MSADYDLGRRDGKIEAIENMLEAHTVRLDNHESRLRIQEKITYGLLGAIALIQFAPILGTFFA